MQRTLIIVLIVLIIGGYVTTYTVRFTETAVVTTLGKAGDNAVQTEPGLRFRVPYVQQVTTYDRRARYLESLPETLQTADDRPLIVTAYVTWRVSDPKAFYQKFSGRGDSAREHYRAAEELVRSQLRSGMSELSKFRLEDLLSSQDKGSRLGDLEDRILTVLKGGAPNGGAEGAPGTASASSLLTQCGIEAKTVGIKSIKLPQQVTEAVFASMNANRARIANEAVSQGKSTADNIRNQAQQDATRIMAFAERRAQIIRAQGDAESKKFLDQMNADPRLAVFLQTMEFMKTAYGRSTTLVLPTSMPGLGLLRPDALKALKAGEVPAAGMDALVQPPAAAPARAPAPTGAGGEADPAGAKGAGVPNGGHP